MCNQMVKIIDSTLCFSIESDDRMFDVFILDFSITVKCGEQDDSTVGSGYKGLRVTLPLNIANIDNW